MMPWLDLLDVARAVIAAPGADVRAQMLAHGILALACPDHPTSGPTCPSHITEAQRQARRANAALATAARVATRAKPPEPTPARVPHEPPQWGEPPAEPPEPRVGAKPVNHRADLHDVYGSAHGSVEAPPDEADWWTSKPKPTP